MANVYAVKSGNWSDTTVWNTGSLPTSADDVYSNTFTVAVDTTTTVLSIRTTAATGIAAGGGFTAVNGVTLTLTGVGVLGNNCFTSNLLTGQSCSIIGNITGGGNTNGTGVSNASSGTINITGNCTGGAGLNANGVTNSSNGSINITGNCIGGLGSSTGVSNSSTGSVTITGNCTGGSSSNSGATNSSTGTLNHVGTAQASTTASGVSGAVGATTILSGPFLTASNGANPVTAARWFWQNTTPPATYYQIRSANLSVIRPLYTADSVGGNPATSNVRSGTVYGPSNELTGTCAVPPAGSVALGVPVDNTTGTAYLTQSDIQTAATAALTAASAATFNQPINTLTTPGSIGERLKNSATVATVSQQISDAISSRQ